MLFVSGIDGSTVLISDTDSTRVLFKSMEEVQRLEHQTKILGVSVDDVKVMSDKDVLEYLKARHKVGGDLKIIKTPDSEDVYCTYKNIDGKAIYDILYGCKSLPQHLFEDVLADTVVLPRTLEYIEWNCFTDSDISKIVLPEYSNIHDIAEDAFYETQQLSGIYYNSSSWLPNGEKVTTLIPGFSFRGDELYLHENACIPLPENAVVDIDCNKLIMNIRAFYKSSSFIEDIHMTCSVVRLNCKEIDFNYDASGEDAESDCFSFFSRIDRLVASKAVLDNFYIGCYIEVLADDCEIQNFGAIPGVYYPLDTSLNLHPSRVFFEECKKEFPTARLRRIGETMQVMGTDELETSYPLKSVALIEDDGTERELSLDEYFDMLGVL